MTTTADGKPTVEVNKKRREHQLCVTSRQLQGLREF